MLLSQTFLSELVHEAINTKKVLERVPTEKWNWQPHEKSYTLGQLASHVAELPSWIGYTINADELDFEKMNYTPAEINNTADLIKFFKQHIDGAITVLNKNISDDELKKDWTLRSGTHIIFTIPKFSVLRSMVFNHIIHHRAQLTVYLRMLDIPLPAIYGPTADES